MGRSSSETNYVFSKILATAASYNNVLPDPINLRNDYNPAPYDRSQVFNIHYLIDFGKRYKGGSHLLSEAANGWQISGITSLQSGPPLASLQGENFGFGYGVIQPVQVSLLQQAGASAPATCENLGVPPDKNGNHYCVTSLNPTVWLGSPDYQLQPDTLLQSRSGLKSKQFINPTCFGIPIPGGPSTATSPCPLTPVAGSVPAAIYPWTCLLT